MSASELWSFDRGGEKLYLISDIIVPYGDQALDAQSRVGVSKFSNTRTLDLATAPMALQRRKGEMCAESVSLLTRNQIT